MTPKYKFGYARVSTLEQDEALQHDALSAAGCERIFADKANGKLEHRPALDALLDQLRPGDVVVVWRLDRLGRSLRHLLETIADLEQRGVGFASLTENIDTSTPGGKLVFHLFGALAEFEAALIRERTMAGLAAARARGRVGGRPTVGPPRSWPRPGRCTPPASTTWPPSPGCSASAAPRSTGPCPRPRAGRRPRPCAVPTAPASRRAPERTARPLPPHDRLSARSRPGVGLLPCL